MRANGSRITAFQRGVLENAGLGEVAYFLKKAKTNIEYAEFAFQNTEFAESENGMEDLAERISSIEKLILEVRSDIDKAVLKMAMSEQEEREESPEEE